MITIIINPHAGNKNIDFIIKKISSKLPDSEIIKTTHAGHATEIAKKTKSKTIIAVGGDGTINETINGILKNKNKPRLGIVPIGTSNMLARALNIPTTIKGSIKTITNRKSRKIDIGCINNRHFTIAAGVGLDAHSYKNVEPKIKKMFGEIAYPISLLNTLFNYAPEKLTIEANKRKIEGYYTLICNIGTFSKIFHLVKSAKDDDGYLDILILKKKDIPNHFKYLLGLITDTHKNFPDIEHIRAKQLKISSKKGVLGHADAELVGKTPFEIKVLHKAIRIIC